MAGNIVDLDSMMQQFLRDNKSVIDLIGNKGTSDAFKVAIEQLFGPEKQRKQVTKIGNLEIVFCNSNSNRVALLPSGWRDALVQAQSDWPGCENWWAGLPLVVWIDMHKSLESNAGYLRLNAEVGPVADHDVRRGIIERIQSAAITAKSRRIRFSAGAMEEGCRYSRFIHKGSVRVSDVTSADNIELNFKKLIADFRIEFELVASALRSPAT
jgi:hypothetical protein